MNQEIQQIDLISAELRQNAILAREWLLEEAFPFWAECGVDPKGGFVERFYPDGSPSNEPRRARLVARQIYAFATAELMNWGGPARAVVEHGIASLRRSFLDSNGMVIATTTPEGKPLDRRFNLYDHAFVIFGLSAAVKSGHERKALTNLAEDLLARLIKGWKHALGGFQESRAGDLPLKANPHMHLFEACLAWEEVSSAGLWTAVADEIAELCLSKFLDPETGALREYFCNDWSQFTDQRSGMIEPGHQFEWAWLLLRWGRSRGRLDAIGAARRLVEIGETYGTDPVRDLAMNELNSDLSVHDPLARLWPQTERLKALLIHSSVGSPKVDREEVLKATAGASRYLKIYRHHPIRGCWWEHIDVRGQPVREPTRASSLYHLVCSINEFTSALDLEGN